jgi:hemolysin D
MRGGASAGPADSNKFTANGQGQTQSGTEPLAFRTSLDLKTRTRDVLGGWFRLSPGTQVSTELNLGMRTVVEYLRSPVAKAFQEAGRER